MMFGFEDERRRGQRTVWRKALASTCALLIATTAFADVELIAEIKRSDVNGDEAYAFGEFGSAGLEVIRVFVTGLEPGDFVNAVYSAVSAPMTIWTSDRQGFFNAADLGQQHGQPNPALFAAVPELQWDTWVAIDDGALFTIFMPDTALEDGGTPMVDEVEASWLVLGGVETTTGTVLVGQFAHGLGNEFEIILNIQIIREGDPILFEGLQLSIGIGEPEGACCVEGDCQLLTEEGCDAAGGTWDGSETCDEVDCGPPPVEGACCIDEECSIMTEEDCATALGEWDGSETCDGVDCSGEPPPPTDGACCALGSCFIADNEDDCLTASGEFGGVGTTCDEIVCEAGACCVNDGCSLLSEDACLMLGGTFDGAESCDLAECNGNGGGESGACCIMGECAIVESAAICTLVGGDFGGIGSTCDEIECEPLPTEGACCVLGECFISTEGACTTATGEFGGVGTTCNDIVCEVPEPEGACCLFGECSVVTEAICDALGGDFNGSPTCDEVNCPVPDGVCCLLGACLPIDGGDCDSLDGTFHPNAFSCADVICDPTLGACCINGEAIVIADWQCDLVQGEFMGFGMFPEAVECDDAPIIGCPGDVNNDGVVDILDLIQLLEDLGCECIVDCDGKVCGNDGCGGSCGLCPVGFNCVNGQCVPKSIIKSLLGGFKTN